MTCGAACPGPGCTAVCGGPPRLAKGWTVPAAAGAGAEAAGVAAGGACAGCAGAPPAGAWARKLTGPPAAKDPPPPYFWLMIAPIAFRIDVGSLGRLLNSGYVYLSALVVVVPDDSQNPVCEFQKGVRPRGC